MEEAKPRWYRKKHLCKLFGVAPATIDRWTNEPAYAHLGFPKSRKLAGTEIVYWLASEVDPWAEERERKAPRQ